MEKFEKKVKSTQDAYLKGGLIVLIIAVLIIAIGISKGSVDKESLTTFDGISTGEYFKEEIYFLDGPFAEKEENGKVTERLFCALTKDNTYILVKTGSTTDLPILGKDITEKDLENIESLETVKVYGQD